MSRGGNEEMSEIYDNARRVLDMAADAAIRSGRAAEDVMVLAASKMNGRENIREAYRAGFRLFGENRAQELRDKLVRNMRAPRCILSATCRKTSLNTPWER